jgi:hypothetical protein
MLTTQSMRFVVLPALLLASACVGRVGGGGDDQLDAQAPSDESTSSSAAKRGIEEEQTDDVGAAPIEKASEGKGAAGAAACADISDEDVLRAVYDGIKVPPGYFADAPETGAWAVWDKACAPDLESTRAAALAEAEEVFGELTGVERTTPYFYEVDIAQSGAFTEHFRQTRCDYFDGSKLAGAPHTSPEALAELAIYSWYARWANAAGYAAVGGVSGERDSGFTFTLCAAQTTFGECGACDTIALLESSYSMTKEGFVEQTSSPALVRLIHGRCDVEASSE